MNVIINKITLDFSEVEGNIYKVAHDDTTKMLIQARFAQIIDPYVPYDTGALSQDIEIDPEGVTYTMPYAQKQYYGVQFNHNREHHPLASAYWDKVAMHDNGDYLLQEIKDIIIRRFNNG